MNSDSMLIIVGNAISGILAITSLVSGVFIARDIKNSRELKDKKSIRKGLTDNTYLMENRGVIVPMSFIYGHKNSGCSPRELKELEIDDTYSLDNMSVLMDK